jgi:hypothetical protein
MVSQTQHLTLLRPAARDQVGGSAAELRQQLALVRQRIAASERQLAAAVPSDTVQVRS